MRDYETEICLGESSLERWTGGRKRKGGGKGGLDSRTSLEKRESERGNSGKSEHSEQTEKVIPKLATLGTLRWAYDFSSAQKGMQAGCLKRVFFFPLAEKKFLRPEYKKGRICKKN